MPDVFIPTLEWARKRIDLIVAKQPNCDRYFIQLPERRTSTALLRKETIWLNYAPNMRDTYGGVFRSQLGDIGLGPLLFPLGRWKVMGTLIHELAHINGAPGHARYAENAVLQCGLGRESELGGDDDPHTPYNPNQDG